MMTEYEKIIKKAAENRSTSSIPNSTIEHAKISMSYLIRHADSHVYILSKFFPSSFWAKLGEELRLFIQGGGKVDVLTVEPVNDDNEIVRYLSSSFPSSFTISTLPQRGSEEFPNFLVTDNDSFRYEVSDKDFEKSMVTGIINFNNSATAKNLVRYFKELVTAR